MSQATQAAPRQLAMTQDMTIYHALEQKQELLDALAAGPALELDLSQVNAIDSAGLQLLLLVKREASRSGKEFRLTAHSPAVREVIEFTRLGAHFGDPMVIPRSEAG